MQFLFYFENRIPLESFLLAFIITFFAIPYIVEVFRIINLYDVPGDRTSHRENTPTLGGLTIFAGFVIVDLTGSHKKATFIILIFNVLLIAIALLLSDLRIYQIILILFTLAAILSSIPYFMIKKKTEKPAFK